MAKFEYHGKFGHKARSAGVLLFTLGDVLIRRLIGRPTHDDWGINFEIGVLFWRRQYLHGLGMNDIRIGRAYLDSLVTLTDDKINVTSRPSNADEPNGDWHTANNGADLTIMYVHGGGNSLYPKTSYHFGAILADFLNANVFMPNYRLIPEHPYPAQHDDVLEAYEYLLKSGVDPKKLVVIGDSGGGNLVLKLALKLRNKKITPPALTICLSPWTGVGKNSESLYGNDKYDILQGDMLFDFAKPLPGEEPAEIIEIPNIELDFKNVSPLYIQAGGSEILIDLIEEFAETIHKQGAEITLDVWPAMTHVFQTNGRTAADSAQAFECIEQAIEAKLTGNGAIPTSAYTTISSS